MTVSLRVDRSTCCDAEVQGACIATSFLLFMFGITIGLPLLIVYLQGSGVPVELQRTALKPCVPTALEVPRVEDLTLEEKIGQMTMVGNIAVGTGDDVARFNAGALLSGGGQGPPWGNEPSDWADMVDHFQAMAQKTRLKIPIIYGIDAIHGHNNVHHATIFPHHIGLGAAADPDLTRDVAAAAAKEVAATGVRWTFAPAVSVVQDVRWGRTYESFSESTQLVEAMTTEVDGWQVKPTNLSDPAAHLPGDILVAATAKHYLGDGATYKGVNGGDIRVDEDELRERHLPPFKRAVARNVQSIMVGYHKWRSANLHGHHYLLTQVLRDPVEMGDFDGVLVSDWNGIQWLPGDNATQVRSAINAGFDMIMVPVDYKQFVQNLTAEVEAGRVAMERIDQAVGRTLKMKERLGLFQKPCSARELLPLVGCREHRDLARRAVRQSLTLLKNDWKDAFPLAVDGKNILVSGSHANNIGLQCGGWTITWQGGPGNSTVGTTILEGVLEATGGRATVDFQEQPNGKGHHDYAIVVVGEPPYAETPGDDPALRLDASGESTIYQVCRNMPCVVVLVVGRPLEIEHLLKYIKVLVVAWLPGTEGAGVADVLFGHVDFNGRLPVTWPRTSSQLPMRVGDHNYNPLFPFGFGLTKSAKVLLPLGEMVSDDNGSGGIRSSF